MFSDSMMLGGGRQAAFSIARSVRLDGAADHFIRTPSQAGSATKWLLDLWVKRTTFGKDEVLFSTPFVHNYEALYFGANDSLVYQTNDGTTNNTYLITTRKFRDPAAHINIRLEWDSAMGEESERTRLFINGVRETAFSTKSYCGQNNASVINGKVEHRIGLGHNTGNDDFCRSLISRVVFVDNPSSWAPFGETDPITGSWRPVALRVADYGPNGFYLDFATPADLGRDVSGNGNHWTPVSLGAADVVADTPTNSYCTLNPLDMAGTPVPTRGNLVVDGAYSTPYNIRSTFAVSTGKWYWEVRTGNGEPLIGILDAEAKINSQNTLMSFAQGYCYSSDGQKRNNGNNSAYGQTWTDATIGVALDLGAGTLAFYKDGVAQGVAFTGLSGVFSPCLSRSGLVGTFANCTVNFGQVPFTHTPPAGFKALCTANMPAPTVPAPARHMDVVTYTGTGTARAVGGLAFQPDLVWIKAREETANNLMFDSVRGPLLALMPNRASRSDVETTLTNGLDAFTADGFTLAGATQSPNSCNTNQKGYVAWCWKAGAAAVANTDGQVPSQVSVNPAAGFSIVTFSGQGSAATIGHGLGAKPAFVIIRSRNSVGTNGWNVWHQKLNSPTHYLDMATWSPQSNGGSNFSGEWTESHFKLGQLMMSSGANLVAYCWAEVPGYSKFGLYTGNGDVNGPFVACGFRPRFVLIKRIDTDGNDWRIWDTERATANPGAAMVFVDLTDPETNAYDAYDITSSGFKLRNGPVQGGSNADGGKYIFAAFAESPQGGARTVPAKGR